MCVAARSETLPGRCWVCYWSTWSRFVPRERLGLGALCDLQWSFGQCLLCGRFRSCFFLHTTIPPNALFFFIAGIQSGRMIEKGTFPFPFERTSMKYKRNDLDMWHVCMVQNYWILQNGSTIIYYMNRMSFCGSEREPLFWDSSAWCRKGKPAKESTWMARAKRQWPLGNIPQVCGGGSPKSWGGE